MSKINRRTFLGASAIAVGGLSAYSYYRGLRIPGMHWDPRFSSGFSQANQFEKFSSNNLLCLTNESLDSNTAFFRAYAPEPSLTLTAKENAQFEFRIVNISPKCQLRVENCEAQEQINGTQRDIIISLKASKKASLEWHFPGGREIRFAAIGDSGGDRELRWCLYRAQQLECDFLLHLGDFNYQPGDYDRAVSMFNNSPVPVYVSIGNHDFHEDGATFAPFLGSVGPLNHSFEIGGIRFINLDTAANFLPAKGGERGRFINDLRSQDTPKQSVVFTHRPLIDPIAGEDHDIGSAKERDWLLDEFESLNVTHFMAGHIHIQDRRDLGNLDHIIVGQGLGHQDLIVGQNHSSMALGTIKTQGQLNIEMASLAMPMSLHCHPRVEPVKQSLEGNPDRQDLLRAIDAACAT